MSPQSVLALGFLAAAAVSGSLACVAWRRRAVPGASYFALLLASIGTWAAGSALEALAYGVAVKVFWTQIQYVAFVALPVLWLLFALDYTGESKWITRRNVAILLIIPALTLVAVFSNPWHHAYWTFINAVGGDEGGNLLYGHGPLFYASIAYDYLLLFAGTTIVTRALFQSHQVFQLQGLVILLGVLIPWLWNLIYVAGQSPVYGVDLAPLAMTLSGVFIGWGLFRYRLFDLAPVARNRVVESLDDPVIVLDAHDRVADANPAALALLGANGSSVIGRPADAALHALPGWNSDLTTLERADLNVPFGDGSPRFFRLRISPLKDGRQRVAGRMLILHETTDRVRIEQELHQANSRLQEQLTEIRALQTELHEQAIRDPLTHLFNRRYMEATLAQDLARAEREGRQLILALMDIDHFKALNDTFGHSAGDAMLQALAAHLRLHTRKGDLLCRLGGEEFVAALAGTSLPIGLQRAEEWRASFADLRVCFEEHLLRSTLSIGVAAFPQHGHTVEQLMRAADRALYAAKAAGRNCVRTPPDAIARAASVGESPEGLAPAEHAQT